MAELGDTVITAQLDKLAYRITSLEAANNNLELEKRVTALETFQQQFHTLKIDINLKVDTFTARLEVLETDNDNLKTRLQVLETNQTTTNLQVLETNQTTTNLQQRFANFEDEMKSRLVGLEKQSPPSDALNIGNQIGALEKKIEALEKGAGNRLGSNVNQSKEQLRKQKEEMVQHVEKIEKRAQTDTNVLLIAIAFFLGFNSTLCYNSAVSALLQGAIRIFGIIWFVGITYVKVDEESRKFRLMMKKHADLVLKANKVDDDEKKEMILAEARLRAEEHESSGTGLRADSNVGDSIIGIDDDPSAPLIRSDGTGRQSDTTGGQSDVTNGLLIGDSFSSEVKGALQPYKFRYRHIFPTLLTGVFGVMITVTMLSGKCKSSS